MPRVLIIGASFAGRRCKKVLSADPTLSVTLIDAISWAEYTPSILRCLVDSSCIDSFLIPHAGPGFLHGLVEEVVPNDDGSGGIVKVRSSDGVIDEMPFDYLIMATGSLYKLLKPTLPAEPGPSVLPDLPSISARKKELIAAAVELKDAGSVVVIGGGTVGVELAAEIAGHFVKSKKKTVTLVTSKSRLLDRMPHKAGEYAAQWLQKRGVEVIFNTKCSSSTKQDGAVNIQLSAGKSILADLVYNCTGIDGLPGTSLISKSLGQCSSDSRGGISINSHFQVLGASNIFACGDAVAGTFEKTAYAADLSANIAAENVIRMHRRSNYSFLLKADDQFPSVACVSLYKWDGLMQLNGLVLTGFIAAFTKVFIEFLQLWAMKYPFAATLWLIVESITTSIASLIPRYRSVD